MTANLVLVRYEGEGEFKAVSAYWGRRADNEYVVGETYSIGVQEYRSQRSHNHLFQCIKEAHKNLTDEQLARWPTPLHLRKYVTIKAGYYDCKSVTTDSKATANRVAAFLRPMDEFSVVIVHGCTVAQYVAKSLSEKDMDKQQFQEAKDKILTVLSDLIGVTPEELAKAEAA